jgi:membrane protein required for colicin V production
MTYTWIDYLIIVVFALSMLLGLKRGFIKEAISLATVITAFFIAITFSSKFANSLDNSAAAKSVVSSLASVFGEANVSDALALIMLGLSFFILFILTMIVGEIINKIVSGVTLVPGLGMIDHLLGAGFGAVRAFLISVVILFLLNLTSVPESKAWTQSQFQSKFESSIIWLSNIVKPGLEIVKDKVGNAFQDVNPRGAGSVYNGMSN